MNTVKCKTEIYQNPVFSCFTFRTETIKQGKSIANSGWILLIAWLAVMSQKLQNFSVKGFSEDIKGSISCVKINYSINWFSLFTNGNFLFHCLNIELFFLQKQTWSWLDEPRSKLEDSDFRNSNFSLAQSSWYAHCSHCWKRSQVFILNHNTTASFCNKLEREGIIKGSPHQIW